MEKAAIKIGSSTLAMRACEIVRNSGMECELRKLSDSSGKYGCLYSIYVDSENNWRAESMIRSAGIMVIP